MRDKGALEPLYAFTTVLLIVVTMTLMSVWAVAVRLEMARSAADAAALAAGAADCAVARAVATRNQVRLDSCAVREVDVRVRVSLPSFAPALLRSVGVPDRLTASARASRAVLPPT